MRTSRFLRLALGVVAVATSAQHAVPVANGGTGSQYFCERFASSAYIERIATGPDGSVCVAGVTGSGALPGAIAPPQSASDWSAFVTVFEPDGGVRWTRYLPHAWARDIRVAPDGSIWTAFNFSDWGPRSGDARVTKLGPDGTVLSDVDLAATGAIGINGLALAANGDAVIAGTTSAADFPVAGAFQPEFGGGKLDGFVARIRSDGSGFVWSGFLGGPGPDDANAVTLDASGDVLVTTRERAEDWDYNSMYLADLSVHVRSVGLTRISGDGSLISAVPLPSGDLGGAFDVAVAADGRILVGGAIGYFDRGPVEGYVLPVDPVTSAIGVPWHEQDQQVHRIALGPDGTILVGTEREWYGEQYSRRIGGGFVHLTRDLDQVIRRLDREERWGVLDVAVASDGALCLAGSRGGAAVLFNENYPGPHYGEQPFVARLPASGVSPPSHVRVVRTTATETTLAWPRDCDPVVAFEVERGTGNEFVWPYGRTYSRLKQVPASASGVRLRRFTPGSTIDLRLVAIFASGVRSAVSVPSIRTPPVPVERLVARSRGRGGVMVRWDHPAYGNLTTFELQRKVGNGSYERVPHFYDSAPSFRSRRHRFWDRSARSEDGLVTYRVRAVTSSPQVETPWKYSLPVLP